MRKISPIISVVAVSALLLGGCGSNPSDDGPSTATRAHKITNALAKNHICKDFRREKAAKGRVMLTCTTKGQQVIVAVTDSEFDREAWLRTWSKGLKKNHQTAYAVAEKDHAVLSTKRFLTNESWNVLGGKGKRMTLGYKKHLPSHLSS